MRYGLAAVAIGLSLLLGCTGENQFTMPKWDLPEVKMPVDKVRLDAWHALREKRYDEAQAMFEDCVTREPGDMKSHYYLGMLYLEHAKNPYTARRHLEQAYEIRRMKVEAEFAPRPGTSETAVPWPTRVQIADGVAEALYQQDARPQLLAWMRESIESFGDLGDYMRFGKYLYKMHDPDGAVEAYRTACRIAGAEDERPYVALAEIFDEVGDREAGLIEWRKAYFIRPSKEIAEAIRAHGTIPGPTIALDPTEAQARVEP